MLLVVRRSAAKLLNLQQRVESHCLYRWRSEARVGSNSPPLLPVCKQCTAFGVN